MHLDCPHCGQSLQYSGKRPSFCAYCGKSMDQPKLASTADFAAQTATLPPELQTKREAPDPETVGGYKLVRRLGAGGMGSVYEAEDSATGRHVALKLIAADYATAPDAVERFRREGQLASAIAHPRCVFVLAADEDAGRPYIVMELMPGNTLKDLIDEHGALPRPKAIAMILDVINGLREAHRLGVIHRDVKPSNCFLEATGRVKIGDFGLSKSLVREGHLTQTGTFLGTPLFASPEQVRGETIDQQTDVYSVAATLYCMLTGRAPFQSSDAAVTLARIAADPAPPMRTLRPELPPALDEVVLRGLERDRLRRWRNLDELRNALLPFLPGQQAASGQGVRFGAFVIDYFVLMLISLPIAVAMFIIDGADLMDPRSTSAYMPWQLLFGVVLWAVCWCAPESVWGCSLGKWLLGLRVRTAAGTDAPGAAQLALRTLCFYVLANLGSIFSLPLMWGLGDAPPEEQLLRSMLFTVVFYPSLALGIGLIVCTMRARNGYRGLHEFVSGTRVVRLPAREKRRPVRADRLDQTVARQTGLSERIGAYTIRGTLWQGEGKVFLADDAALQRQVVIHLRPQGHSPLAIARREVTRPTRLRWLAGGQHDGQLWDAFLAPGGRSLPELVAEDGTQPWSEVRPILEQLAAELWTATDEGTLPVSLSVDQVWVQSSGQIQLLDWPFNDVDEVGPGGSAARQQQGLVLVAQAAVLTLEGRRWRPDEAPRRQRAVRAPLPEHAADLLARLLGLQKPFDDVQQFERELQATRDRPAEVTRGRRAAHLTVLTALIFFVVSACLLPAGWMPGLLSIAMFSGEVQNNKQILLNLEEGTWREFAASAVNPSPWVRLGGLAQLNADLQLRDRLQKRMDRDQREREARLKAMSWLVRLSMRQLDKEMEKQQAQQAGWRRNLGNFRQSAEVAAAPSGQPLRSMIKYFGVAYNLQLVFWLGVWVLWAFVWRGGLTFRWLGLSLTRSDGRKAARWQCALRALLVWAPPVALWTITLWLDVWYWSAWPASEPEAWVPWLSWGLWWTGLILLPVYAMLAILYPRRSLHDWLAGTYLVPR
jgi:uncharacterized RDD family membrane protein YckC